MITEKEIKQAKIELLSSLKNKGISDDVLNAIANVPREKFVNKDLIELSYKDKALPLSEKQTISQPYTVAYMTMHLDLFNNAKVLEIGTGSGYQTAILSAMNNKVYSIERIPSLFSKANETLSILGYSAHLFLKDGTTGLPDHAPFDRIIITAAAPEDPIHLVDQLTIGGKMIVPVGNESAQIMKLFKKTDNEIEITNLAGFKFVPLIGVKGWNQENL
jgi:protein-L-isoaspartate(D-aspartate) O-methyltransferase